ncbi:hypothetical protein AZE42_12542, partial [Rhizopogon vesiculosus]
MWLSHPYLYPILLLALLQFLMNMDENIIRLELSLKYPETIRVTFIPDLPGPLTIEIIPSSVTVDMLIMHSVGTVKILCIMTHMQH